MNSAKSWHNRSVEITIDLAAVKHNYSIAKRFAGSQKLFAVVKSDAYGHGAIEVAKSLRQADGFAVVTVAEALELRNHGVHQPILVLQGPQSVDDFQQIVHHDLWCSVHDREQLAMIYAQPQVAQVPLWIKLDTGMGRLGFTANELPELKHAFPNIVWSGMMTHFACADEIENGYTAKQIAQFNEIASDIGVSGSMANSAGILAWPDSKADWARPGLMLYGCSPIDQNFDNSHACSVDLLPAMRVTAPIIALKRVTNGSSIGYARTYICEADRLIAYLGVGYGDGLPRILDKTAKVMLHSEQCPLLGRVSMDSIAIDVSAIAAVKVGERATLWGPEHPVERLANAAGTISYELLTNIRGHRVYID